MQKNKPFGLSFYIGLIIMTMSCQLFASEAPNSIDSESLALRKIMSNLGKEMENITHGISLEDWKLVEKSALQIAEHPKPPFLEKIKILSFVGTNVGQFKAYDKKTHDAAIVLSQVAIEKDGLKVISEFSTLQNTCLACHQSFRQSFLEHFYNSEPATQ